MVRKDFPQKTKDHRSQPGCGERKDLELAVGNVEAPQNVPDRTCTRSSNLTPGARAKEMETPVTPVKEPAALPCLLRHDCHKMHKHAAQESTPEGERNVARTQLEDRSATQEDGNLPFTAMCRSPR